MAIATDTVEVPGHLIRAIAVHPISPGTILIAVEGGATPETFEER